MKKILIILSMLLTLVACTTSNKEITYTNTVELNSKPVDMSVYPNIDFSKHQFKAVTMEESFRLVEEKGSGVILYAKPSCNFCRMVTPIVNDVATKYNVEVYYVDCTNYAGDEIFNHLTELYQDYLSIENGEPQFYIPHIFVIKNGEVVAENMGFLSEYQGGSLTKDQYEKFYGIVEKLFLKLSD